ncbi:helicase [Moumouvirus goulette]|uniref:Helicase n=1 Tax=Moumouvirus goulette TaxID=1247379 RepID=M1PHR2_9VIRU|nr:helicase [Moumouvirus goulette]AGF85628.1 helicase [Moumouvirus goulette]
MSTDIKFDIIAMSTDIKFDITFMENDDVETIKKLDFCGKLTDPIYTLCAKHDSVKILEYIYEKRPDMKYNYFANSDAMHIAIINGSTKVFTYIIDNGFYFSHYIKDIILDRYTNLSVQIIGKKKIMQIIENSVLIISVDNVVNYKGEQVSTFIKSMEIKDNIHKPKPKYIFGINTTPAKQTSLLE